VSLIGFEVVKQSGRIRSLSEAVLKAWWELAKWLQRMLPRKNCQAPSLSE
jgi:hypothetical protein